MKRKLQATGSSHVVAFSVPWVLSVLDVLVASSKPWTDMIVTNE
jgi:hypothetical protein